MKKAVLFGIIAFLSISGCSPMGTIDKSKIPGETKYKLSTGQEIILPLRYKNWKWMMATFSVPASQVQKYLPSKLKPILFTPGKALISFGVLEYPDVSALKPYNEYLVSIPVQYEPSMNIPFLPLLFNPLFPHGIYKKGGSYIYHLPVTTAESHQAGKEIWGFPKVVREIKCKEDEEQKTCDLLDNGMLVMSLQISKITVSKERSDFSYCSYTEKDNKLLRTFIPANGNYCYSFFGKASINFGEGQVADEMRKLDIDRDNPLQVFFADNLTSTLPLAYERLEK